MRIATAIAVWLVLVGGLALYMNQRVGAAEVSTLQRVAAPGVYSIVLTATFGAAPDPFALRLRAEDAPPALRVQLNGETIYTATDTLVAGAPVEISPVPGIKIGENEFFVEATPSLDEAQQAHAIRVNVYRDGSLLVDETLWSEPGLRVATPFRVDVAPEAEDAAHDHG